VYCVNEIMTDAWIITGSPSTHLIKYKTKIQHTTRRQKAKSFNLLTTQLSDSILTNSEFQVALGR
jgi:hypothetical protein